MTLKRITSSFLPPITVDRAKIKIPMYRQLYEWFRRAILNGQLRPGQRVPSTRNLAAELGISRIPVSSAYEQLCMPRVIWRRSWELGTCVARSIPDDALKPSGGDLRGTSRQTPKGKLSRKISRRVTSILLPPQSWLDNLGAFRVSLPALEHFSGGRVVEPDASPSAKADAAIDEAYNDAMGYLPFREAIAEYLGTVRAVRCEPSQILVTTGSQQGLQLSAHVLLDANDRVWVEEPGYHGARNALIMAGAGLVAVPVDQEGLDVKEGIRRERKARGRFTSRRRINTRWA